MQKLTSIFVLIAVLFVSSAVGVVHKAQRQAILQTAPVNRQQLDVVQGLHYNKDKTPSVGYVTSLKIGDTAIAADFVVTDPTSPTKTINVVGVMNKFYWSMVTTETISFSFFVTAANRAALTKLVGQVLPITIRATVLDFDYVVKTYFPLYAMKQDVTTKGQVVSVAALPDFSAVSTDTVYLVTVAVGAPSPATTVTVGTSYGKGIDKVWGN
eukprot:TRINITY_DN235_c0_g1_i1.p1 TRINITY_DN235_c0_g1~~TRINITY_DN235_c0_g1_i1.p1  ORF type:complete len:212 (+),score=60.71 TRINITY_DN235_c0_g1_i1:67-702(+)